MYKTFTHEANTYWEKIKENLNKWSVYHFQSLGDSVL